MNGQEQNRISSVFRDLANQGGKALIAYIMAGDPNLETTFELVKTLVAAGTDIIELGVPFSDPIADGPSIQRAGQRALETGTNLTAILALVTKLRQECATPIVLMSYYNPLLKMGLKNCAELASQAGVDGFIVPDLPLDESAELAGHLSANGMYLIPLLAPTSTDYRIQQVAGHDNGFVYCVSLTGVTGSRSEMDHGVYEFMQRINSKIKSPVAIGFGISTPAQAREMSTLANGVIIGSAIVNLIEEHGTDLSVLQAKLREFVIELKQSLR